MKRDLGLGVSLNYRGSSFILSLRLYSTRSILNSDWANLTFAALNLTFKADTHEGFCSRSMLQAHFAHEEAFSSSLNLPRELAPKHLTCWVSWSILRGGNYARGDDVYPLNRWYTRRSFAPGVCAWSMLREQISSCVSAFRSHRTGLFHAYWVIISCGLERDVLQFLRWQLLLFELDSLWDCTGDEFFFFNKCLKRDCSFEIKRFLVSCYCNIIESVHSKVMFHTAIIAVV